MQKLLTSAALILMANAATARDAGNTSVALGVSTLGTHIEAAYQINPTYRLRSSYYGGTSVDYEYDDNSAQFEGDAAFEGLSLIGDFYPTNSGWRISAGVYWSQSEFEGEGIVTLSGMGSAPGTATADFNNDVSAMVTTGYDWAVADGWRVSSEIGVIFTGGIDVTFTADDPTFQPAVDAHPDLQEIKEDAADMTLYPYLGLSVAYQF